MNPVSTVLPDPCLERVIERFPNRKSLIEREYVRSESFHSLCNDWLVCSDTIQRWRSVDGSLAQSRRSEYLILMAELEEEIASRLDSVAKTAVSPTDLEY
ncbi:MAG: hypothetical protein PVJ33_17505 [Lysobacterales bacterium]|jgi:hypothetical protein